MRGGSQPGDAHPRRAALPETGALQEAIERAETVLQVDPANADARRIESQARSALSKQHDRLDAALVEADKAAEEEGLEEAIRILTPFESDPAAAFKLAEFRKELQELEAHDRAVAALVAKARDLIAGEKFVEALDVLSEGKTLDPENEDFTELRRCGRSSRRSVSRRRDPAFEKDRSRGRGGAASAGTRRSQFVQGELPVDPAAAVHGRGRVDQAPEREQERKRKEQEREQERLRKEQSATMSAAQGRRCQGRARASGGAR